MKKKLLTVLMAFTLLMSTACGSVSASEENDVSQENVESTEMKSTSDESNDAVIGKSITINTENGSFSITAKGAHEVDWDYEDDTMKIVTIQAEVENIDFSDLYDGKISNREIYDYGVSLLDDEEFGLEFYNISGPKDGKYEVDAETPISSKKRVSLPFFVPTECNSVFIKVNGEISNPIILGDVTEENNESESAYSNTESYESEDTESETTEKFIAQGNTTLMNFLSASSDNGYGIIEPNREGAYVSAVAEGTGGNYNIRYMVENQHVFAVEVYADSVETINTEGYLDCVYAMAKSINPDIDSSVLSDSVAQAIASPNEGIVDSDTQFRYDSDELEISISY